MGMEDEMWPDGGECRHHQGEYKESKERKEDKEEREDSVLGLENSL